MAASQYLAKRDQMALHHLEAGEDLKFEAEHANPSVRRIRNAITKLNNLNDNLVRAHQAYVKSIHQSLFTAEHSNWIKARSREVKEAKRLAEDVIERLEPTEALEVLAPSNASKLRSAKLAVNVQAEEIKIMIEEITETASQASLTATQIEACRVMILEVEEKLEQYPGAVDAMAKLSKQDEVEEQSTQLENFLKANSTKLIRAKGKMNRAAVAAPAQQPPQGPPQAQVAAGDQGVGAAARSMLNLNLVKCTPEKFDGSPKNYLKFKRFWEENMSHLSPASQYMYLMEALAPVVKENISCITSDIREIWSQLDSQFGRPEVMGQAVVQDILKLDKKKLGDSFLIKLSSAIDETEVLLRETNQLDWLTNTMMVSSIEAMLPEDEQEKWAEKMDAYDGTKFEKLQKFLKARRQILENKKLISGPKKSSSDGKFCTCCRKTVTDHTRDTCPNLSKITCKKCNEKGHFADKCASSNKVEAGEAKNKKAKKNNNAATSIEDAESVNTNTLRAGKCLRCKYVTAQVSECPGCKAKGEKVSHCIFHCEVFSMASVEERVKMVKVAKYCAVCLFPAHQADSCKNKESALYECGLNGCKKHHHPSLHGSKDSYITTVGTLVMQQVKEPEVTPVNLGEEELVEIKSCNSEIMDQTVDTVEAMKRLKEMEDVKNKLAEALPDCDNVLLTIQEAKVAYGAARNKSRCVVFFDDGSTCSLILTSFAESLHLENEPVSITLNTVNGPKTRDTKLYCIELVDRNNKIHLVKAFGMEKISSDLPEVCVKSIKEEFSKDARNRWNDVQRPRGQVHMLLGSEEAHLHPIALEKAGKLILKKSLFGTGRVLNGTHKNISSRKIQFSEEVEAIRGGNITSTGKAQSCNRITFTQERDFLPRHAPSSNFMEEAVTKNSVECDHCLRDEDFLNSEDLGVEAPKRCKKCRKCSDCSFRGRQLNQQEAEELKALEDSVSYDPASGRFKAKFVFLDDPRKLGDNRGQVTKIAEQLERRLVKENLTEAANEVFNKMLKFGALEEISPGEQAAWTGPTHYVSIQHVVNLESQTTPVRLVTNSSLRDRTGISLNDILVKGPNMLCDVYEILTRFRSYIVGAVGDITKAYYCIKTGLVEKHVRRVLWRFGDTSQPFKVYGFVVASMGDRPSACILEIAIREVVTMFGYIHMIAGDKLMEEALDEIDELIKKRTEALTEKESPEDDVEIVEETSGMENNSKKKAMKKTTQKKKGSEKATVKLKPEKSDNIANKEKAAAMDETEDKVKPSDCNAKIDRKELDPGETNDTIKIDLLEGLEDEDVTKEIAAAEIENLTKSLMESTAPSNQDQAELNKIKNELNKTGKKALRKRREDKIHRRAFEMGINETYRMMMNRNPTVSVQPAMNLIRGIGFSGGSASARPAATCKVSGNESRVWMMAAKKAKEAEKANEDAKRAKDEAEKTLKEKDKIVTDSKRKGEVEKEKPSSSFMSCGRCGENFTKGSDFRNHMAKHIEMQNAKESKKEAEWLLKVAKESKRDATKMLETAKKAEKEAKKIKRDAEKILEGDQINDVINVSDDEVEIIGEKTPSKDPDKSPTTAQEEGKNAKKKKMILKSTSGLKKFLLLLNMDSDKQKKAEVAAQKSAGEKSPKNNDPKDNDAKKDE